MKLIKGGNDRLERWERTVNRVCPLTGRHVTWDDVEAGHYGLHRIDGDSANGYEVRPTGGYIVNLIESLAQMPEIKLEPKYTREVGNIVVSLLAEHREFLGRLQDKGLSIVFDEDGLVSEYISS